MINIGIDCDGVQFNWAKEYSKIIRELGGDHLPIINEDDPIFKSWNWEEWYPADRALLDRAWEVMTQKDNFWENIEVLNPDQVNYMCKHLNNNPKIAVYFITARVSTKGNTLIRQTIKSLEKIGWTSPQVIVSFNKAPLAEALDLKYFLDDRPENCAEVAANFSTKVFVMDRPYNRNLKDEEYGLIRVSRLEEFTDIVLKNLV